MPFKSDAQRKYFNAHRSELERQGVDVNEWNQASRGMNLPEHSEKDPYKPRKKKHANRQ